MIKKMVITLLIIVMFFAIVIDTFPKFYTPKTMVGLYVLSTIQVPVGVVKDVFNKFIFLKLKNKKSDIVFPTEIIRLNCDSSYTTSFSVKELKKTHWGEYIEEVGLNYLQELMVCETPKGKILFKFGTKNIVFGKFGDLFLIEDNGVKKVDSLGGYADFYKDSQDNVFIVADVANKRVIYEFDGKEVKKVEKYSTNNVLMFCPNDEDVKNKCPGTYLNL